MTRARTLTLAAAAAIALALAATGAAIVASAAPREVNVTTDSASGWLPSEEQTVAVEATLRSYLAAKDAGNTAEADAYRADGLKSLQPLRAFAEEVQRFNAKAGAVHERRILKVTWTKDPSAAPSPGVYAAVDLQSRFAKIQRHCGYVVLYQKPTGGPFKVMREEANFLDDATAKNIERVHSAAEVDATWAKLSANCPNFSGSATAAPAPIPEVKGNVLGYSTVAAALAALKAQPGVKISVNDGWTIAEVAKPVALWSFAPPSDPAYPAVAKREMVAVNGSISIQMSVHCEASKAACDDFVRRFQKLNEHMANELRERAAADRRERR